VKRTFSKEPQFSTGLSREKTLKADRQKVGNLFEAISVGGAGEHWNHPVARLQMLSVLQKNQRNLSLSEMSGPKSATRRHSTHLSSTPCG
jgi:hypothetical protein